MKASCAGAKLMKLFTTAKMLQAEQVLLSAAGEKCFKFNIAIYINCVEKMLL